MHVAVPGRTCSRIGGTQRAACRRAATKLSRRLGGVERCDKCTVIYCILGLRKFFFSNQETWNCSEAKRNSDYIYTSVNPCIKCMEWSLTQLGGQSSVKP